MIEKVEGIIISETPYGDTSKIINVLTKDYGIIGIMAKGAKSMKSKLRAVTIKFTYGYFHIYYKKEKLSLLIDVDIIDNFNNIKKNLALIGYLNYLTELTTQVYKQNNDERIYPIFINSIKKLDQLLNPAIITNIVEIKYLDFLGIGLNLNACINCGNKTNIVTIDPDQGGYICKNCYQGEKIVDPKIIKLLRMYYYVDINSITELKINEEIKNQVNYFLAKYYERYTGLYLKSKEFLKQVI